MRSSREKTTSYHDSNDQHVKERRGDKKFGNRIDNDEKKELNTRRKSKERNVKSKGDKMQNLEMLKEYDLRLSSKRAEVTDTNERRRSLAKMGNCSYKQFRLISPPSQRRSYFSRPTEKKKYRNEKERHNNKRYSRERNIAQTVQKLNKPKYTSKFFSRNRSRDVSVRNRASKIENKPIYDSDVKNHLSYDKNNGVIYESINGINDNQSNRHRKKSHRSRSESRRHRRRSHSKGRRRRHRRHRSRHDGRRHRRSRSSSSKHEMKQQNSISRKELDDRKQETDRDDKKQPDPNTGEQQYSETQTPRQHRLSDNALDIFKLLVEQMPKSQKKLFVHYFHAKADAWNDLLKVVTGLIADKHVQKLESRADYMKSFSSSRPEYFRRLNNLDDAVDGLSKLVGFTWSELEKEVDFCVNLETCLDDASMLTWARQTLGSDWLLSEEVMNNLSEYFTSEIPFEWNEADFNKLVHDKLLSNVISEAL